MKKYFLFFFIFFYSICYSQQLFNSQLIYEDQNGLFDESILRDLHVNFYDSDYNDFLIQSWFDNTKLRRPATFEMDGVIFDSVAVRYKGNSTFYIPWSVGNPKLPFNIDINDYNNNQDIFGYNKIKLANALFDPSMRKEITGYSVYRNYMPAPQSNFINLTVNNDLLGLYVNTESVNAEFMDKHFNENNGVFFKCEAQDLFGVEGGSLVSALDYRGQDSIAYYESYELKSDSGWKELTDLIYTLNNDIDNIEKYLNVDRALWYLAVNTCILNADTYSLVNIRNYYMYQTENGQFQIIPWDVSESFIGALFWWWGNPQNLYEASPYHGYDPYVEDRPLVYNLLSVENYKNIYDAHLRTIINQMLNTNFIYNKVEDLGQIASDNAQLDPNTFFGDGFDYNVNQDYWSGDNTFAGILNTLSYRTDYLNNHPVMNTSTPDIEYVSQNIQEPIAGDEVVVTAKITNVDQVELMITTQLDHFNFTSYLMNDNGVDGDLIAADNIFSLIVPFSDAGDYIQYYIRATNDESISLSPEKAEYEFYYYTVFPEITANSDLVINEIMASNNQAQADEFGEYDDWIEVYNTGLSFINLGDYYLSDDINILDKYNFPSITLAPNEYFIVWADDDEEDQGDNHATFKLSVSGEAVYLSDANFNLVDGLTFGEQQTDMGYARIPNGTGPFVIQNPTFLENNDLVSSQIEYSNDNKLIKIIDVLGREISSESKGFHLNIFKDNTVKKEYNLSY